MRDAATGLNIDSATGIEVSLPLAGPGARSFAFIIDWHIRLVLALAWYVVAAILYAQRLTLSPPLTSEPRWFGFVLVPPLLIYFLYHPLLEVALRGSTPGKRTAGVRVTARDGSAPSVGAVLTRNVFRLIDCLPAFYGIGLITVMLNSENLRWGDMAAGTLLVYADAPLLPPVAPAGGARSRLDAAGVEIVGELLSRWATLTPQARVRLTRQVLRRYNPGADADGLDETACRERLEQLRAPA